MDILEDFYGYDMFDGANKSLASKFTNKSALRARDFFRAHGDDGGLETWYFLDKMDFFSFEFEDGTYAPAFEEGKAPELFLRDKLTALFLIHDDIDKPCAEMDECAVRNDFVETFQLTTYLAEAIPNGHLEGEKDMRPAFRDSFHRFLDLFENDPKPSFKLLTVFSDFYEDYESEPEYAAEHLNTLCDTYQGMSPDEKNNFDPEVLVQLTAPCTT